MTEKILNIYQRINAVMSDIAYVKKDAEVSVKSKKTGQSFTYKATSHDAVIAAVRGALVKHGIAAIPTVASQEQYGQQTRVVVRTEFVNIDSPEDRLSVESIGYGDDFGDKGPGKAVSYAVKYAMLKTFCLETGVNDESRAEAPKHHGSKAEPVQQNQQAEKPWFNDQDLQEILKNPYGAYSAYMAGEVDINAVIAWIRQSYKVSRQMGEKIKGLAK